MAETSRDTAFSSGENSVAKQVLPFGTLGRERLRDERFEFCRKFCPVRAAKVFVRTARACVVVVELPLMERVDEGDQDWKMVRVEDGGGEGATDDVGDGPGDDVGEMSGDEADVRGGGASRGNACWEVEIEKCKVTAFDGLDKRVAACIIQ